MGLKQSARAFICNSVNKALNYCDDREALLKPLLSKIVAIEIQGINKTIFISFSEKGIHLSAEHQENFNSKISGGPFSLLNILLSQSLDVSGVYIEGEISTAQQLKTFAESLDIDWESLLADYMGDTPAYYFAKIGKKFKLYKQQQGQQFKRNLSDYVKDEIELLPSPIQVEKLFTEIDELRFSVDRLNVRINQFKTRVGR